MAAISAKDFSLQRIIMLLFVGRFAMINCGIGVGKQFSVYDRLMMARNFEPFTFAFPSHSGTADFPHCVFPNHISADIALIRVAFLSGTFF